MRFAATKLVEGDELILEKLGLDQNEKGNPGAYCKADGDGAWA